MAIYADSLTTGTTSTVKPTVGTGGYSVDDLLNKLKSSFSGVANQPQFGFDNATQTVNTINAGIQGVTSLGNLYLGFESLSLAKDSAELEKKKWEDQQKEIDHLRDVRKRLTERF